MEENFEIEWLVSVILYGKLGDQFFASQCDSVRGNELKIPQCTCIIIGSQFELGYRFSVCFRFDA